MGRQEYAGKLNIYLNLVPTVSTNTVVIFGCSAKKFKKLSGQSSLNQNGMKRLQRRVNLAVVVRKAAVAQASATKRLTIEKAQSQ